MRTLSASILAFATVACALVAAPAPASAADVCGLVTTAEASTAMGASSLPGNVFVQTSGTGDMIGAGQMGGKAVSGIGDKAVWAAGSIFVQKGAKVMQVGLYRSAHSMEKMDPQIVPLAKIVAGRM